MYVLLVSCQGCQHEAGESVTLCFGKQKNIQEISGQEETNINIRKYEKNKISRKLANESFSGSSDLPVYYYHLHCHIWA